MRSRLEQANDNAAGFWLAQARVHGWEQLRRPGFTAVRCARDSADAHRVVVTRPYGEAGLLEAELDELLRTWGTTQLCLEDPYGHLDLSRFGCVHGLAMAVMTRPGVIPSGGERAGRVAGLSGLPSYGVELTVSEVLDAGELAAMERTVVEGFPIPARQPWVSGGMLPLGLLGETGLRAWLARVAGRPAGGCLTYDDGDTVGVYWVTTLAEHRSRGVARALLETALAAQPDRPATLVATLLGEPLYRKLGFVEQGLTRWWGYPAAPGAR
ncbi:GNAT family N-acetyltransferase [Kitasatospora sp. NBC_00315]|uniref:GNAT family N-acetyltransferase n=1 Tax=Kitasatospora sp. NBC_00315 TaxID=2975963 RepID=UPI00324B56DF